ncbi:MAG: hypothetical protein IPO05_05825 [Flavobacteriales bacterium]|nr:hypothetical protein [Flavobacteriales bacterium]
MDSHREAPGTSEAAEEVVGCVKYKATGVTDAHQRFGAWRALLSPPGGAYSCSVARIRLHGLSGPERGGGAFRNARNMQVQVYASVGVLESSSHDPDT